MPLQFIHSDITTMKVDAIVNSANKKLTSSVGVCSAIHKAAGPELEKACLRLCGCTTGKAKRTLAYHLPCKYVIHTVAPTWSSGTQTEKEFLFSCYYESLKSAKVAGCKSIAFPLLSSGLLHCPEKDAIKIAVKAINSFLDGNKMQVYLILFTQSAMKTGKELYPHLVYFTNEDYLNAPKIVPKHSFSPLETPKKPSSASSPFPYNTPLSYPAKNIPHIQNLSIPPAITKPSPAVPNKTAAPAANISAPPQPNLFKEIPHSNSILFIRKGVIACMKHKHPIVDATALLKNLDCQNVALNVQHCISCNRFFIHYDIYRTYQKKYGTILGDIQMMSSENFDSYIPDLSLESKLHLCGYSVGQKENLSDASRHSIIASVIESGIMQKHEVIYLIQYLIELNKSKKTHKFAIQKWSDDLDFTLNYNSEYQKKYALHSIIPYAQNRYIVQGVSIQSSKHSVPATHARKTRIFIPDSAYGYGYIVSESDYLVTTKFDNGETFVMDRSLFNSGFVQVIQPKPKVTVLSTPPEYIKKTEQPKKKKAKQSSKAPQEKIIISTKPTEPCLYAKINAGDAYATCTKSIATRCGQRCALCKFYTAASATKPIDSITTKIKAKPVVSGQSSPQYATSKNVKQQHLSANPKIGCVHLNGSICSLKDAPCKNAKTHCLFFITY